MSVTFNTAFEPTGVFTIDRVLYTDQGEMREVGYFGTFDSFKDAEDHFTAKDLPGFATAGFDEPHYEIGIGDKNADAPSRNLSNARAYRVLQMMFNEPQPELCGQESGEMMSDLLAGVAPEAFEFLGFGTFVGLANVYRHAAEAGKDVSWG